MLKRRENDTHPQKKNQEQSIEAMDDWINFGVITGRTATVKIVVQSVQHRPQQQNRRSSLRFEDFHVTIRTIQNLKKGCYPNCTKKRKENKTINQQTQLKKLSNILA